MSSTREQLQELVKSFNDTNKTIKDIVKECRDSAGKKGAIGHVFTFNSKDFKVNHKDMIIEKLRNEHKLTTLAFHKDIDDTSFWILEVRWD